MLLLFVCGRILPLPFPVKLYTDWLQFCSLKRENFFVKRHCNCSRTRFQTMKWLLYWDLATTLKNSPIVCVWLCVDVCECVCVSVCVCVTDCGCECVSVYVCECVCVTVCWYVCVSVCMFQCVCERLCVTDFVCVSLCVSVCEIGCDWLCVWVCGRVSVLHLALTVTLYQHYVCSETSIFTYNLILYIELISISGTNLCISQTNCSLAPHIIRDLI